MIIVAGRIYVQPGTRNQFLGGSTDAMVQARKRTECLDFVVAADPLEPDRVNVFEAWTNLASLEAFRGSGPDDGLSRLIVKAEVGQHEVSA